MTGNAIRLRLARLDAPSAHAWRRGWAVRALRAGGLKQNEGKELEGFQLQ